jgi:hypothetical protein
MANLAEVRVDVQRKLILARSLLPDSVAENERDTLEIIGQRVPAWHPWEQRLWEIGEAIRKLLATAPSLRRDEELGKQFLALSLDRRAGLGRQSFMMLLGFKSFASLTKELISELNDDGVCGHVVWALNRARVLGVSEKVRDLCDHKHAWIRREAKRCIAWDGV